MNSWPVYRLGVFFNNPYRREGFLKGVSGSEDLNSNNVSRSDQKDISPVAHACSD